MTSSSQSKPAKNTDICSVLTRQHAKKRCFGSILHIFQLALLNSKTNQFLLHFCQRSSGLKKVLNHKKHLKSTFFLSQSLLQSSNSIIGGACLGPKCCKLLLLCFMNVPYHAFYLQKKYIPPPQLKLTCC